MVYKYGLWYDNPIPTRFLAPIDCLKIQAQKSISAGGLERQPWAIPTRFLAPIDCYKIPEQGLQAVCVEFRQ